MPGVFPAPARRKQGLLMVCKHENTQERATVGACWGVTWCEDCGAIKTEGEPWDIPSQDGYIEYLEWLVRCLYPGAQGPTEAIQRYCEEVCADYDCCWSCKLVDWRTIALALANDRG